MLKPKGTRLLLRLEQLFHHSLHVGKVELAQARKGLQETCYSSWGYRPTFQKVNRGKKRARLQILQALVGDLLRKRDVYLLQKRAGGANNVEKSISTFATKVKFDQAGSTDQPLVLCV